MIFIEMDSKLIFHLVYIFLALQIYTISKNIKIKNISLSMNDLSLLSNNGVIECEFNVICPFPLQPIMDSYYKLMHLYEMYSYIFIKHIFYIKNEY